LCRGLVREGHEVHVCTTNVDGDKDSDVPLCQAVDVDGVKVHYFSSHFLRRLYFSIQMVIFLKQVIRDYDVVHLHSIFLWPTLLGARLAEKYEIPYVVSPRGMLVKALFEKKSKFIKSAWVRMFEKHSLENASSIHLTSEVERKEIEKFCFNLPMLKIIPNGIELLDASASSPSEELEKVVRGIENKAIILYLGRISWEKGIDRLIRSLEYCQQGHLVIAGNDEEEIMPSLKKIATDSNVVSRMTFVGGVNDAEKNYLIDKAKVLVLPSHSENFGIVVLEAMARKCPVVVTEEVGLADIVYKEDCGMVTTGDARKMGAAIAEILNDPEKARIMGINGLEAVKNNFTWSSIVQKMLSLYQDILRERG
jgi:glycosyltransferase involved in cell wall biosynthesis